MIYAGNKDTIQYLAHIALQYRVLLVPYVRGIRVRIVKLISCCARHYWMLFLYVLGNAFTCFVMWCNAYSIGQYGKYTYQFFFIKEWP